MRLRIFAALFFIFNSGLCVKAAVFDCKFAGSFYPKEKSELNSLLKKYFENSKPDNKVRGILVPHAGYEFSADVAASAWKEVPESFDTVIILATSHKKKSSKAVLANYEIYKTPIGEIKGDLKLKNLLLKEKDFFIEDNSFFEEEHSFEVHLPFLAWKFGKNIKILPVLINSLENASKTGFIMGKILKGKNVFVLVSSDLSHYPRKDKAFWADNILLKSLESMDAVYIQDVASYILSKKEKNLLTPACALPALIGAVSLFNEMDIHSFRLAAYSDSYLENPLKSSSEKVVGYGSGFFLKEKKSPGLVFSEKEKLEILSIARKSIKSFFDGNKYESKENSSFLNLPVKTFVTLNKNGNLRGCVGNAFSYMPLKDAVSYFAWASAFEDDRFSPLKKEELDDIDIEVSFIENFKKIDSALHIKPFKDGVFVENQNKSGIFLPQVWLKISDKEKFLQTLCEEKAQLEKDCWKNPYTNLYSFEVFKIKEEGK